MFKANGRVGKERLSKERASAKGKEFACTVCDKRKQVANVEFGEQVLCECGNPMIESYEE
jgi:hypothetical protein